MSAEEVLRKGLSEMTDKNIALQIEIMVLRSSLETMTQMLLPSTKTDQLIGL